MSIRHDPSVPDRRDQVVPADDPVAVLHQVREQVEDLGLDRDELRTAAQLAQLGVKPMIGKDKLHVGAQADDEASQGIFRPVSGKIKRRPKSLGPLPAIISKHGPQPLASLTPGSEIAMADAPLSPSTPTQQFAPAAASELAALKTRQQAAWSSGDYAVVGTTLQIVGEQLCEALDLRAGRKVLDVAAGNGMASLAAARRWCAVTSTDYVPALLASGRARAAAEGLVVDFREADAEDLPFADGAFDTVLSTFGVMFTPDQDQAAAELLRVCRPLGQIGLRELDT